MTEKKPFHRSTAFYIVTASILIILSVGIFIWRNYKYKLVDKKLDTLVTSKSKGLYEINYKNLIIDEVLGNISVENVDMLPDSMVYQSMIDQKTAPENLFYIRIPKITVTGVKTPKALLNKEISAHIIRIENAEIELRMGKSKPTKEKTEKPDFGKIISGEIYQQILGKLNSIQADSVVLENANLILTDKDSKALRCKAKGVSFRFATVAIDSTNQNDSTKILFSKEIAIHCNQLELPSKNKIYDFHISGLDYNSQTGNFHTDQIRLKPLLSETEFAKANKYAKDRFDILIDQVDLIQISRQGMLNQQLIADQLEISKASFHIFRDKSYPHDSVDRTHDYPQEAIMSLPIPVYVKNVVIKDSYIEYKEKNDKSDSSGKVAFFHVNATIHQVTNMHSYIRANNQMILNFKASFLNQTPFSANISMRLNDNKGRFQLNAQLGQVHAVLLNPLLKPMALAEFDRGEISSLNYHLDADNTQGKGRLILIYDDFKIKLLKKDDDKNKYKTKPIPTLAAGLLLKKANPQNGKTRVGNVDYTRDIHRSFFNMMWKSLFTAMKEVAL